MRVAIILALLATGCATVKFTSMDDGAFKLTRNSDLCAVGSSDAIRPQLLNEASKLCAMRREVPVEIESGSEYGIPYMRCASAWAIYRCEPKK